MARLNLYFKLILSVAAAVAVCGFGARAYAINVHALYTASCQREVGIILSVSPRQISLLNLDGQIVTVERYDVIYFATFPLDVIPVAEVKNPDKVPLVEIKTYGGQGLETLVRGWPVDFSQDKISFLNLRGSEIVIDRTSIWQVNFDREARSVKFNGRVGSNYEFVHPYAFSSCPQTTTRASSTQQVIRVFPQQLLSDPVPIKREFDRLAAGHDQVERYESAQQFYAIPELYKNETSLGLWLEGGDRYGASNNRKNNFTPLLTNQFSSGPFGFQSEFRTGSGPLLQTFHDESQTQTYYRLKADYFHFTGMVDPNLILVGPKYKWSSADLNQHDVRANESAMVEFGFDYGPLALELYLGGAVNAGAREGELFRVDSLSIPRVGLRYQNHSWLVNVLGGSASANGFGLNFVRANVGWLPTRAQRFVISVIERNLKFGGTDMDSGTAFSSEANALSVTGYGYWRLKTRYWLGVMVSAESLKQTYGRGGSSQGENRVYPKGGAMISLTF